MYSGVDVVDVLSDRMQNVFDPTPLDRGLAMQAQAYVNPIQFLRRSIFFISGGFDIFFFCF